MTSEVVKRLRKEREQNPIPEGFPKLDLSIDELPDFRTITDFDESGDLVAVVSHPGWNSHHKELDTLYRTIKSMLAERNISPSSEGLPRSRLLGILGTDIPENPFFVRQNFLEEQLFGYLASNNIPTIATIPVITYNSLSEAETKRQIDSMIHNSVDPVEIMRFILSQERMGLSEALSKDFPDYLREIRGNRENFYLAPTDSSLLEEGEAIGYLLGDYNYRGFEQEVVFRFLEAVDGRKVLFAGNNIRQCLDMTLGYFRFVDSEVLVLLNYCGISSITLDEAFVEYKLNGQDRVEYARRHPQERLFVEKVFEIFGNSLIGIEEKTNESPFYQTSSISKISGYTGYVTDLDEEGRYPA